MGTRWVHRRTTPRSCSTSGFTDLGPVYGPQGSWRYVPGANSLPLVDRLAAPRPQHPVAVLPGQLAAYAPDVEVHGSDRGNSWALGPGGPSG